MTHIEALFAVEALATLVRARPSGVLIVMTRTSAVVGGAGDQSADGKADKERQVSKMTAFRARGRGKASW